MEYYGQDISGNEADSILRKLKDCFKNDYHGECAGFYNQGFPASSQRHVASASGSIRLARGLTQVPSRTDLTARSALAFGLDM